MDQFMRRLQFIIKSLHFMLQYTRNPLFTIQLQFTNQSLLTIQLHFTSLHAYNPITLLLRITNTNTLYKMNTPALILDKMMQEMSSLPITNIV